MRETPSWFGQLLGPAAQVVLSALAPSMDSAHGRASDAQQIGRLKQRTTYGATLWLAVYEELLERMQRAGHIERYRPKGAMYDLSVVNGVLLFPFEVDAEKTQDLREALVESELRRSVIDLSSRRQKQQQVAFELDGLPPVVGAREALTDAEIEQVLLIPYQCDYGTGLTKVAVGLGELRLGVAHSIDWSEFDLLSLDVLRAGPQLLELPEDEPSFTSPALPELPLMGRPRPVENPEAVDDATTHASDDETGSND